MADNSVQVSLFDGVEDVEEVLTVRNSAFRKLGSHVVHYIGILLNFGPDLLDCQFIVEWHISPFYF